MPQDMPPSGGYEPVQYRRNLPVRGFKPSLYIAGVGVIMTYGLYKYGQGVREMKYVFNPSHPRGSPIRPNARRNWHLHSRGQMARW